MKAWCLFEQSGTFKNEFKKLGIQAYDVDILNEYRQTDIETDLFVKEERQKIAERISKEDIVIMFFPCIRFCRYATWRIQGITGDQKNCNTETKLGNSQFYEAQRSWYYTMLCQVSIDLMKTGATIILENPYSKQSYLVQAFPIKPTIVIEDRKTMEDAMQKPTAFWWIQGEPKNNFYLEAKEIITPKRIDDLPSHSKERSEMTPQFARRFIKTFILEEKQ